LRHSIVGRRRPVEIFAEWHMALAAIVEVRKEDLCSGIHCPYKLHNYVTDLATFSLKEMGDASGLLEISF
jgi:hypothetical protein